MTSSINSSHSFSPSFDTGSKLLELNLQKEKNSAISTASDFKDEQEVNQAQGKKSALNQISSSDKPSDVDNKLSFASQAMASVPSSVRTLGTQNHLA